MKNLAGAGIVILCAVTAFAGSTYQYVIPATSLVDTSAILLKGQTSTDQPISKTALQAPTTTFQLLTVTPGSTVEQKYFDDLEALGQIKKARRFDFISETDPQTGRLMSRVEMTDYGAIQQEMKKLESSTGTKTGTTVEGTKP